MNTNNNIVDQDYGYVGSTKNNLLSIEDINDIKCKYCKPDYFL